MKKNVAEQFFRALDYCFEQSDFSSQKELCISAGLSSSIVSELLGHKKTYGPKTQSKIAHTFGYELVDFLALGRQLLEGKDPLKNKKPHPHPRIPPTNDSSAENETLIHGTDFKMSDALAMTARVLESGTSYATALYLNIQHFERAVRAEAKIAQVENSQESFKTQLEEIRQQITDLKRENEELRCNKKFDRRSRDNPEMPPAGGDRRSGKDRRKAVGEE